MFPIIKKVSKYDQEIPQSHSADQPTTYIKHVNPGGRGHLWPYVHNLNKKGKYLLDKATQNIKAIRRRFLNFSNIYFCPCDLDIHVPFDQLFERAI